MDSEAASPLENAAVRSLMNRQAKMAHEVRNALSGMSLALRALRGMVAPTPEALECIEDLEGCLARIDETVSRALDSARERPAMPVEPADAPRAAH
ncbi:MAG: hypothetical protein FJ291_28925 [Planctomycetes bacterium]|nr:hypothetical protein [Planctomycetota bacterium]